MSTTERARMRTIKEIIVHCAATIEGAKFDVDDIDRWHKDRGWSGVGYHYVITLNGSIQVGRKHEKIGAHAKGHNRYSIGVCYIGGLDKQRNPKDTRTDSQKESLLNVLKYLLECYPEAKIIGHRDISAKACPSFNATEEYKDI